MRYLWDRRAVIGAVALVAALLAPSAAFGWFATTHDGVITVQRHPSADSTTTAITFRVYTGYKGGATWTNTYPPSTTTSWTTPGAQVTALGSTDSFEVPFPAGQSVAMVEVSAGRACYLPVVAEDSAVMLSGTPSVKVSEVPTVAVSSVASATISHMPSVTVEASVTVEGGGSGGSTSIDGTLPVTVAGISGVSDTEWGFALVVVGGLLGFATYRGLGQVWMVHRD